MNTNLDQFDIDFQEKPIDWRSIFEKILINWKWFVFSGVFFLIVGAVYTRMQSDEYEHRASILIIDQSRSGQMNEMSLMRQLDVAGGSSRSNSMVNNEEQVLKSTVLMKRVVDELDLYATYYQNSFLKKQELYTSSPYVVYMDSVSLSRLDGTLQLTILRDGTDLSVKGSYKNDDFTLKISELPTMLKTPAGFIFLKLRKSPTANATHIALNTPEVVHKLSVATEIKKGTIPDAKIEVTLTNPLKVTKSLAKTALTTEVGKMIDVIDLSVRTGNAQKGKDILNTLTRIYNKDASEQNNLSANNTAHFIDSRLHILADELSDVEKDVENYKQSNNLTDIDEDAKVFLTKTNTYEQQQIQVELQQNLIKYVQDFIQSPANKYSVVPNLGITDESLAELIVQYNTLQLSRSRIADGSSDTNPALRIINLQLDAARKAVQTGIANSRKGMQITHSDLAKQNNGLKSKLRNIPRQEREMLEIKRQQQVKAQLYLFLLQKREEASLNMAISVPKGRVLNTPDEASVVGPNRNIIMLVFFILGLIIPGIIIYILDLFNTKIKNRDDVEKHTSVPVITELDHYKEGGTIIDHRTNANSNSELFRLLRTKLQFILNGSDKKVILITSTMSGEGKTFVSTNLSIMLSLAEKKVLLVGMDLRKPQLSKLFDIKNINGLTALLSGQEADYKALIYKSKEYPNLHVLPAGIIPPNPTELLMKPVLKELIESLKSKYDYIIIDSAPVGAVSDSFLINHLSDMSLYVCRAGYTDIRNIDYVNRILKEKNLSNIYLIVNDVNLDQKKYKYNRRYGYAYGYGSVFE